MCTLEYHKPRSSLTELWSGILCICPCDTLNFPQEFVSFPFLRILPLRLLYLRTVTVFTIRPKLVFNLEGRGSAFNFFGKWGHTCSTVGNSFCVYVGRGGGDWQTTFISSSDMVGSDPAQVLWGNWGSCQGQTSRIFVLQWQAGMLAPHHRAGGQTWGRAGDRCL